ncbi:Probable kinetochore protein NUF2 [Saitozyma sp. JCM 24511]|nr:Probable kinetochore protein NUF2 [Saitozyma sp. JCM 24511]
MSQHRRVQQPIVKMGFPSMSVDELCACLAALGIAAQPEDLNKPTTQSAQAIYAGLLDALMAANAEGLEQPKAVLLSTMEYKDLYSDGLSFAMYFRHLSTLARVCGVDNFSMTDVTRPEGQRFKRVLSGMMNFAKFRDEKTQLRDELQGKLIAHAEKADQLRKQLDNIEQKIADITRVQSPLI